MYNMKCIYVIGKVYICNRKCMWDSGPTQFSWNMVVSALVTIGLYSTCFRYYVQLPTEAGHEFHTTDPVVGASTSRRLDPKVARMIREMVSGGETRLYAIRKALRSVKIQ